jgi:hypothetical protein
VANARTSFALLFGGIFNILANSNFNGLDSVLAESRRMVDMVIARSFLFMYLHFVTLVRQSEFSAITQSGQPCFGAH